MNETLIKTIISTVGYLGATALGSLAFLKALHDYHDRVLKQTEIRAKETSAGETALKNLEQMQQAAREDLIKTRQAVREDMDEMEKDISEIKDDMFKEKLALQDRLEKLRNHFEAMTRDYIQILSKK